MPFYFVQDLYQTNQLGTRLHTRIRDYNTGEQGVDVGTLLLGDDKNNALCSQSSINYSTCIYTLLLTLQLCYNAFWHIVEGN